MSREFPAAKFYDCRESERLSFTDPEDAILDLLDGAFDDGDLAPSDVESAIRKRAGSGLVVECYDEDRPDPKRAARHAIEAFAENFTENYGDPDGSSHDDLDAFANDDLVALQAAFEKAIANAKVWSCKRIAKVTVTPDEAVAVARENRPEWFGVSP